MLPWLAWLLALMSGLAPLLAALGWTRARKRRPSLKALELQHWLAGAPAAPVFQARRPSAAAAGPAPETEPAAAPPADPRAIARFVGAALYQLSGLPLLLRMVDARPPPKRADEPEAVGAGPAAGTTAVRHGDLDGLQFYRIVADVGAAAVARAVRAGIGRAAQRAPAAPLEIIRDQYPDLICLERRAPAAPAAPQIDLLSALLRADHGCAPPTAKAISPHRAARQHLASPRQRKLETSYLQVA